MTKLPCKPPAPANVIELLRIEHRQESYLCQRGYRGAAPVEIGEDVREQLEVEPARFSRTAKIITNRIVSHSSR